MSTNKKSFNDFIKSEKFVLPKEGKFSSEKQKHSFNLTFLVLTCLLLCFSALFITITLNSYNRTPQFKTEVDGQTVSEFIEETQSSHSSGKININTASLIELCKIKNVGEKRAEDIIAYRKANNGFKSIEDIKNISGIGDKIFKEIKDSICV